MMLAPPEPSAMIRRRRFLFSTPVARPIKLLVERLGCRSVAAVGRQSAYLEHPHPSIECNRHYVTAFDLAARRPDPRAIDPHMTGGGKRCRAATRTHNPRVP